jgi:hypothetical protein
MSPGRPSLPRPPHSRFFAELGIAPIPVSREEVIDDIAGTSRADFHFVGDLGNQMVGKGIMHDSQSFLQNATAIQPPLWHAARDNARGVPEVAKWLAAGRRATIRDSRERLDFVAKYERRAPWPGLRRRRRQERAKWNYFRATP